MQEITLEELECHLKDKSYVCGFLPTVSDYCLCLSVPLTFNTTNYPNFDRWLRHIKSFSELECQSWPLGHTCYSLVLPKTTVRDTVMPPTDETVGGHVDPPTQDNLPQSILNLLAEKNELSSMELAKELGVDHQKIVGAFKSLQSVGNVVNTETISTKRFDLTDEGKEIAEMGSHEARIFSAIPENGIKQTDLMKSSKNAKIGFSKAMAAGWIAIDKKSENGPIVLRKVESIEDNVQSQLKLVLDGLYDQIPEKAKAEFKKRKLLCEVETKSMVLRKGSNFTTNIEKPETDLTAEMLASGSWKDKTFKPYNFDALGAPAVRGHLHPLMKVKTEFRQIFLEMGFSEMPTNNYVESSFWNFDALFVPQQHPARDEQDTFFVSDPHSAKKLPKDYVERIKKVHSEGDYGSQGYGCEWKLSETTPNVLRTHTTAVTARMLYKLAQEGEFRPVKYFSIDRVFRNETLDATHLAEFHQIEGVVAMRGLNLGHLIGTITEFFNKMGISNLKFKPAYNPYTEPSMEIFSYHDGLKKWVEIGNSGLFRPEMLLPMGLPQDVNVAGFGLSLERPTMIRYGYDNIRDLIGPKVNLKMIHESPVCRLAQAPHIDSTVECQHVDEPFMKHIAH